METRGIGRFAKLMIDFVPRGQSQALQAILHHWSGREEATSRDWHKDLTNPRTVVPQAKSAAYIKQFGIINRASQPITFDKCTVHAVYIPRGNTRLQYWGV